MNEQIEIRLNQKAIVLKTKEEAIITTWRSDYYDLVSNQYIVY